MLAAVYSDGGKFRFRDGKKLLYRHCTKGCAENLHSLSLFSYSLLSAMDTKKFSIILKAMTFLLHKLKEQPHGLNECVFLIFIFCG